MTDKRNLLDRSARFGFLARGAVYLTVGVLAAMYAFGEEGGTVTGGSGIVGRVAELPGGTLLLAVLGTGLLCYAGWRAFCAIFAPGKDDKDGSTWAKRVGWSLSAAANGFLAFTCFQGLGLSAGSGGGSKKTYLAEVLATDGGRYIVMALGVFLIGVGVRYLHSAYTEKFKKKLKTSEMNHREREWITRFGKAGIAARGVVFPLMGFFLIKAGLASNADQAKGMGGVLREIASQSYGTVLLVVVALGLAAFGAYSIASAKYRSLPV